MVNDGVRSPFSCFLLLFGLRSMGADHVACVAGTFIVARRGGWLSHPASLSGCSRADEAA
eukprot:6857011-Prymnesium_polylepis.1